VRLIKLRRADTVNSAAHDILIILNPAAAKGKAADMLPAVRRLMDGYHRSYEVVFSEYSGHAVSLAEEAARRGTAIVAAAGGDGTCNEVVNGLLHPVAKNGWKTASKTAFAVLPIGRGNDFAYSAGIPPKLEAAVSVLNRGSCRIIDTAEVFAGESAAGRVFINGLGIGFEPLVNLTASRFTRVSGVLSYLLAVVKIMRHYPAAVPVKIMYGEANHDVDTQQISLCNGRRMGGAFLMGPDAVLDDGVLDLCYVNRPVSGMRILQLVVKFLRGRQKSQPEISSDTAGDLLIATRDGSQRLICHVDGEMITEGAQQLRVIFHPSSLSVIA
jgi:diacylglycerol kinase (ATP)